MGLILEEPEGSKRMSLMEILWDCLGSLWKPWPLLNADNWGKCWPLQTDFTLAHPTPCWMFLPRCSVWEWNLCVWFSQYCQVCIALNIFELKIHIKMPVCLQTSLFITQGDLQKIKGRVEGMTLQLQCYEVTSRRAFWKLAGPGENFNS